MFGIRGDESMVKTMDKPAIGLNDYYHNVQVQFRIQDRFDRHNELRREKTRPEQPKEEHRRGSDKRKPEKKKRRKT